MCCSCIIDCHLLIAVVIDNDIHDSYTLWDVHGDNGTTSTLHVGITQQYTTIYKYIINNEHTFLRQEWMVVKQVIDNGMV